ncbi:ABC transporter ATP-binding protein [Deinococcus sp.]|uniref:ABC transporter ATP-binding protein n=1 Tax=Deinococcus sp. TaxID=47478 RepID=UPI0038D4826F
MLALTNLSVNYGAVSALRNVDLHLQAGEVVALLGANGAGKSTVLRTISGLIRPVGGDVVYAGETLHTLSPTAIVARGVAHCPEGRRVFGGMSVLENLRLGASVRSDAAGIRSDMARMLSLFPILDERQHQSAGTLSGGEQQMLALARALMARPKVLLLDEPSLGVAPLIVRSIFATLSELRAEGVTMLLVEQNARAALALADRAYVLRTGSVALSGTAAELRGSPEIEQAYLGAGAA